MRQISSTTRVLALSKQRTKVQERRFKQLGDELEKTGFGHEFRDPDYAAFLRAMSRRPEFRKPVVSTEEMKKQETIADEILADVLSKEGKRK